MQPDSLSVGEASSSDTTRSAASYLKYAFWFIASVGLVSLTLYVGAYFVCVKRIVAINTVYEPPPLVGTRLEHSVKGMMFANDALRRNQRLFRPIHEIDKKWIRPKWWTELTPKEQVAWGLAQK